MKLKVINSRKKITPDYYNIYLSAFIRCIDCVIAEDVKFDDVPLILRKRLIYYGINMVNTKKTDGLSEGELLSTFQSIELIMAAISTITPIEFETIFPIKKKYNGEKYGIKDYFYTKNAMKEMGEDKEIGVNVEELFWEYENMHVRMFCVNKIHIASELRKLNGQKGIAEEVMEELGLPSYTMFKDDKGKEFLKNNGTGEITKVKKAIPRYMRVVK